MNIDDIELRWVECNVKRIRGVDGEIKAMMHGRVLQYQVYMGEGVYTKWITVPTIKVDYDEFPNGST